MATVDINAVAAAPAVAVSPTASPRERAQQRLGRLVARLEDVASRLDAGNTSQTERTALRTRFNDLRRQVNRLDGIVAGEGLETRGQTQTGRLTQITSPARQPPPAAADRAEVATANAASAPAGVEAAGSAGVDLIA